MSEPRTVWLWPLGGAVPAVPTDGPGKFGALRKHEIHTGVDLYAVFLGDG